MGARILDGRFVSGLIRQRIKQETGFLRSRNIEPNLTTILVGDNPASKTYLKNKHAACNEAGIRSQNLELPTQTTQRDLEATIRKLNEDDSVTGILLQIPLPKGLDDSSALAMIKPEKDVDGLHPYNVGLLSQKSAGIAPCTPRGVMVLLTYYGVKISGSHAVVINRSRLVGRPLGQLLLNNDATVTLCHTKTSDLPSVSKQADILVTGMGHRNEFTVGADMVKPGAAVVDVGTSFVDGKLKGDVDFESVSQVASWISPVPGGVGPMTIAMLLYNTLVCASRRHGVRLTFNPDELKAAGNP